MKAAPISTQLQNLFSDRDVAHEESWMISYIDVFVLMTTLFVMLLFLNRPELSHAPLLEMPQVVENEGISEQSLLEQLNALPAPEAGEPKPSRQQARWQQQIRETLKAERLESLVTFADGHEFSELEISSRVLFASGETELSRAGEALLERLLPIIRQTEGLIFIEGHTDDDPISTERFPSNWELAAARATEVLQFFVGEGLDKSRFRAVSYGDTKPLAPNTDEANRQKNRRVNLVIQRKHS